jgi:hypothetical protein
MNLQVTQIFLNAKINGKNKESKKYVYPFALSCMLQQIFFTETKLVLQQSHISNTALNMGTLSSLQDLCQVIIACTSICMNILIF